MRFNYNEIQDVQVTKHGVSAFARPKRRPEVPWQLFTIELEDLDLDDLQELASAIHNVANARIARWNEGSQPDLFD